MTQPQDVHFLPGTLLAKNIAAGPKLVTIQIAEVGEFRNHHSGHAFELTPALFSEIVANFNRAGLKVPIDAEHASEMAANEGSIPSEGAPAMGWIHSLENRGRDGLWAKVEWLEPARTYIKEGRYKYLSPAIRWGAKDRVTGEPIGARLSSCAITNQPFLTGLGELVAARNVPIAERMSVAAKRRSMPTRLDLARALAKARGVSLSEAMVVVDDLARRAKHASGGH